MFFNEVRFAGRQAVLAVAVLLTLGLPAAAQETIQFSKPLETDPAAKANAFMPDAARRNPASFNAPTSLFSSPGSEMFDVLPPIPPPVYSSANAQQWQQLLNNRKNWTLMTPEEILGIPTPEKILGVADPDEDPNLSAEERYMKRQDRDHAMVISNGMRHADSLLWSRDDSSQMLFQAPVSGNQPAKTQDPAEHGASRISNLFFGPTPGERAEINAKNYSTWGSPFDSPAQPPKPTPDQLEGMERFRALMEPPPQDTPQQTPFSLAPVATPDPNMEPLPASFNPNGRAVEALQSDIGRPMGIKPLAGVTGPLPQPKKAPPLVLPPPWMQSQQQNSTVPSAMPQRQF